MTPDGLSFPVVVSAAANKGSPRLWQLHRIKLKNLQNNCIFDHAELKVDEGCWAEGRAKGGERRMHVHRLLDDVHVEWERRW